LLLAETEFGKKIEVTIDPFKGLLLGIFFFTVGMNIDFAALVKNPLLVGGAVVGLILVKTGILYVLARAFRLQSRRPRRAPFFLLREANSPLLELAWLPRRRYFHSVWRA
jgi:Kef-type K+ transport system membrane component KefB